jgi:hypothetical protein
MIPRYVGICRISTKENKSLLMLPALCRTFKHCHLVISQWNHHLCITSIKSPQSELSNGISVDVWVQKLTPNQPISHRDPAIPGNISFFCVPHENLQRHQPTLSGADTTPSICSWFELFFCMVSVPKVVG